MTELSPMAIRAASPASRPAAAAAAAACKVKTYEVAVVLRCCDAVML